MIEKNFNQRFGCEFVKPDKPSHTVDAASAVKPKNPDFENTASAVKSAKYLSNFDDMMKGKSEIITLPSVNLSLDQFRREEQIYLKKNQLS